MCHQVGELAVQAGIPACVLNVVPGFGTTAGAALGRHPDVDAISFTGSTEVGKAFLRYSGESNMKPVSLECGRKSPNVILADAPDLHVAAETAAAGIFINAGQMCNAGSRLVIERAVHDEFLDHLRAPRSPGAPATRSRKTREWAASSMRRNSIGCCRTSMPGLPTERGSCSAGSGRWKKPAGSTSSPPSSPTPQTT